jgi:hypothetical protein
MSVVSNFVSIIDIFHEDAVSPFPQKGGVRPCHVLCFEQYSYNSIKSIQPKWRCKMLIPRLELCL